MKNETSAPQPTPGGVAVTNAPELAAGSPDRFGYSWHIFSEVLPVHEEQFRRWTSGLAREDWQGKEFLDVGCGIGRNSYWAMKWGAARGLCIDVDDRSLAAARRNLACFPDAHVEHRSAYEINEANRFDIVFSIGVLHHIDSPDVAVEQMVKAAKPGGSVMAWLYGRENNEWIVRWFDPLRNLIFRRAPLPIVYYTSHLLTALLWLALRLGLSRIEYFRLIRSFSFRHLQAIVFDHMIPKIAKYYRRDEATALFERAGLENIRTLWVNEMSWTVIGNKPTKTGA
jgi:SAM-dependent methyltransferase